MSACILEQIAVALLTKLEELIAVGHAVAVERPLRAGVPTRPRHKLIVLYQEDPDEDDPPHGFYSWVQPFLMDVYVKPSDTATEAVDTIINDLRSRVEAKLREDPTLGGLSTDLRIRPPVGFQTIEGSFEGVRVIADVHYRTLEDDPYSQS